MKIFSTKLKEIKIIQSKIIKDERGFFYESFNSRDFNHALGYEVFFVQDNHSKSKKDVLRGLHYQLPPFAQAKLVKVISGIIFDVAVDIRMSSPTFGEWVGEIISAENKKQLWIPEGFAHGFLILSDQAEIIYKTNNYYNPKFERQIKWNDSDISITWPNTFVTQPIQSQKDINAKMLKESELFN